MQKWLIVKKSAYVIQSQKPESSLSSEQKWITGRAIVVPRSTAALERQTPGWASETAPKHITGCQGGGCDPHDRLQHHSHQHPQPSHQDWRDTDHPLQGPHPLLQQPRGWPASHVLVLTIRETGPCTAQPVTRKPGSPPPFLTTETQAHDSALWISGQCIWHWSLNWKPEAWLEGSLRGRHRNWAAGRWSGRRGGWCGAQGQRPHPSHPWATNILMCQPHAVTPHTASMVCSPSWTPVSPHQGSAPALSPEVNTQVPFVITTVPE